MVHQTILTALQLWLVLIDVWELYDPTILTAPQLWLVLIDVWELYDPTILTAPQLWLVLIDVWELYDPTILTAPQLWLVLIDVWELYNQTILTELQLWLVLIDVWELYDPPEPMPEALACGRLRVTLRLLKPKPQASIEPGSLGWTVKSLTALPSKLLMSGILFYYNPYLHF